MKNKMLHDFIDTLSLAHYLSVKLKRDYNEVIIDLFQGIYHQDLILLDKLGIHIKRTKGCEQVIDETFILKRVLKYYNSMKKYL